MLIAANKAVSIDYTLTNDAGEVIDSSAGGAPLVYLQGAGNIIPGLEKALEGKAVGDELTPDAEGLDRVMYGFSLFVCLPDGLSHRPSAATGTVMRPSTLRRYAREAGFADVEVLEDDFGFWRFYELTRS